MTKIYSLTEWDAHMNCTGQILFMSINGVTNWLKEVTDANQFYVTDRDIKGYYDITADNLARILKENEKSNMSASFFIQQKAFGFSAFKRHFMLCRIKVND